MPSNPNSLGAPEAAAILASLPHPVIAVDGADRIAFVSLAAEAFFGLAGERLRRLSLTRLLGDTSPLLLLVARARQRGVPMSDQAVCLEGPEFSPKTADVSVAPLIGDGETMVILLRTQSLADRVGQPEIRNKALRPVMGMAALLAHEIKNPLSGIRGAAQLLDHHVGDDGMDLTRVIRDEADRISDLVDRMDVFRDQIDFTPKPVNIHEVLAHVRRLAEAGFGTHVRFEEHYDPSLPPVLGGRSLLIQVFLNLVKNACEAVGEGGRILLATAYRNDMRVLGEEGRSAAHLPLEVRIQDNGPGIAKPVMATLFEPFMTTKTGGTGLGLALVAKAVADHGGLVECHSKPGETVFITRWPRAEAHPVVGEPAP